MLARLRKAQENHEGGFTLIELLVVMIIIGILAAIAIPAFLSQKAKARDTSAKADVSTIGKEVAAYYVDGTNRLGVFTDGATWELRESASATAAAVAADPLLASGKLSAENVASGAATSADDFCVTVEAPNGSTKDFQYSQDGLAKGDCTP